jgi:hypothetical protein
MAPVLSDPLFEHAVTANKWTNRHKKARRGKTLRYRDFIRKPVGPHKDRMQRLPPRTDLPARVIAG